MSTRPPLVAARRSLDALFTPRSVAVIGASRDPAKVGGSVLANLRSGGFPGRIVAVNERGGIVQGLPAVPSIESIDEPIDLAVVAVPAPRVQQVLEACATKDVGAAVVISAGFREAGGAGKEREAALRRWLASQSLRLVGPNCLGWIRPHQRLNVTFAPGMPAPGPIAFVSHSGALAVAILDWSRERRMGFSLFASLGNQADVTEADVIRAVIDDPETRVIVAYLEGVSDGRALVGALRAAAAASKPVLVLKAGRSAEGARAVSSHTGAMAGSDEAFDAAVRQAGAVRVRTIEELFDLAHALARQPLPRGRKLTLVTNGGGLGIVATDAARDAGIVVPPLGDGVQERLRLVLPGTASVANPVDLVGDADAARFSNALQALRAADTDAMLVLLTAQAATDSANVARAIVAATRDHPVPIVTAFVGGARVTAGAAVLEEAGIPCYPFPERAVAALAGMAMLADRRRANVKTVASTAGLDAHRARAHVDTLRDAGRRWFGILDLLPVFESYGIPVVRAEASASPEAAATVAARLGFPVALKVLSPDVVHKTEFGGVRLGLGSPAEVKAAGATMLARVRTARPAARIEGLLVQAMATPGKEMILGAVRDAQFGPLVVVGFGGVYVEVLEDTAARLAPVDSTDAAAMLAELRMAPLLAGVRGEPPVDRAALIDVIVRFAQLAADLPELGEIEINPLIARPDGVTAVDARAHVPRAE